MYGEDAPINPLPKEGAHSVDEIIQEIPVYTDASENVLKGIKEQKYRDPSQEPGHDESGIEIYSRIQDPQERKVVTDEIMPSNELQLTHKEDTGAVSELIGEQKIDQGELVPEDKKPQPVLEEQSPKNSSSDKENARSVIVVSAKTSKTMKSKNSLRNAKNIAGSRFRRIWSNKNFSSTNSRSIELNLKRPTLNESHSIGMLNNIKNEQIPRSRIEKKVVEKATSIDRYQLGHDLPDKRIAPQEAMNGHVKRDDLFARSSTTFSTPTPIGQVLAKNGFSYERGINNDQTEAIISPKYITNPLLWTTSSKTAMLIGGTTGILVLVLLIMQGNFL